MKDVTGKLAVVTGGGSGIGRALVLALAAQGCHVATCDIRERNLAKTVDLVKAAGSKALVTTYVADVTDELALAAFQVETARLHGRSHVDILVNNAGVSGGGSFVTSDRSEWERTFDVCWRGVYLATRVCMPSLIRANEARLVNISSVNGFFAALGPGTPQSAYAAAKFAVKGFTEGLIEDLRLNAPHVEVKLVMPGHIGTAIVQNSLDEFPIVPGGETPDEARALADAFVNGGLSAERAAERIIEGMLSDGWRILIGDDALVLDAAVRSDPAGAYDLDFYKRLAGIRPDTNSGR